MLNTPIFIITKDKARTIQLCLLRLNKLVPEKTEVHIIDSSSTFETFILVKKLKKELSYKIIYKRFSPLGFASARNFCLNNCQSQWLIFLDDDCLVASKWYEEISKAIVKNKMNKKTTAILAKTENYYPKNIWSCGFQFASDYWYAENISKNSLINYQVTDQRNIAINVDNCKINNAYFSVDFNNGGEDADFGIQLQQKKLKVAYCSSAIVFHIWPQDFSSYVGKKINYFKNQRKMKTGSVYKLNFKNKFSIFMKATKRLSSLNKVMLFGILVTEIIINKITK